MEKDNMYYATGKHVIIELYGCKRTNFTKKDLEGLAKLAKSTPLKCIMHSFKPQGKTGLVLLEESHISIHTYPEHKYIAMDVFTCGEKTRPENTVSKIKKLFLPKEVKIIEIKRGIF